MRRLRRDDGAASVEFALVLPLFLLLVGIAAYFAWLAYAESQLQRAAQRAARYAAVPTIEGTYAYAHCDVVAEVNDHLSADAVPDSGVSVTDAHGALAASACPDGATAGRPRGYVRVRVTRTLTNPFADLIAMVMPGPGPVTVTATGEARVEDPT